METLHGGSLQCDVSMETASILLFYKGISSGCRKACCSVLQCVAECGVSIHSSSIAYLGESHTIPFRRDLAGNDGSFSSFFSSSSPSYSCVLLLLLKN